MITIYKKGSTDARAVIEPDDSSYQDRGVMRNDIVSIGFKSTVAIPFGIGDNAKVFGRTYKINRPVPFNKVANRDVEYSLTMEGLQYDMRKAKFFTLDSHNRFTELKFSQRGRAIDFCNLIIANMERWEPGGGWKLGDVIESDYMDIEFDNQNCLEVAATLATKFDTEYDLDGKTFSLTKKALTSGVTLEYGAGKALAGLAMQNQESSDKSDLITRLYVYGGSRNIGTNYRDGAQFLRIGDVDYIEKNADVLGVFEDSIYFDDIYPRREGIVSAVGDKLVFTDADIDFNVNDYLLPGVTAQLTFNTGQMAGLTFDIHSFDNPTKTFTINLLTNETTNLPSDILKPSVGDKYVLIGIDMPLSYIVNAEAELKAKGKAWLNENGPGKVVYPVQCNDVYFKRESLELELGKNYQLKSPQFNIDKSIRLVSYKRMIRNPNVYSSIELADSVAVQSLFLKLIS